jgi:predicted transcriptional regulator
MYVVIGVCTPEIGRKPPMPGRRSRLDLVLKVLGVVTDGVDKPTRIMYAANLSWKPTQRILNSLVQQGLLREIEDTGSKRTKKRYEITEKGSRVVQYFSRGKELLEVAEQVS